MTELAHLGRRPLFLDVPNVYKITFLKTCVYFCYVSIYIRALKLHITNRYTKYIYAANLCISQTGFVFFD